MKERLYVFVLVQKESVISLESLVHFNLTLRDVPYSL